MPTSLGSKSLRHGGFIPEPQLPQFGGGDGVEPGPLSSFPPALCDATKPFPILGMLCPCLVHSTRSWKGTGELLVLGCPCPVGLQGSAARTLLLESKCLSWG